MYAVQRLCYMVSLHPYMYGLYCQGRRAPCLCQEASPSPLVALCTAPHCPPAKPVEQNPLPDKVISPEPHSLTPCVSTSNEARAGAFVPPSTCLFASFLNFCLHEEAFWAAVGRRFVFGCQKDLHQAVHCAVMPQTWRPSHV